MHHFDIESIPPLEDGIDGVCIENAMPYTRDSESLARFLSRQDPVSFAYLERSGIPMLEIDLALKPWIGIAELVLPALEGAVGARLVGQQIMTPKTNRSGRADVTGSAVNQSRRALLKLAAVAAGAYTLLPATALFGRAVSTIADTGFQESAEFNTAVDRIHPELYLFTRKLRNAVIAEKLRYLLSTDKYDHLLITIGAGHTGLEEEIQKDADTRLEFIAKFRGHFDKILTDTSTLYMIQTHVKSNLGVWIPSKKYYVPELLEIAEQRG